MFKKIVKFIFYLIHKFFLVNSKIITFRILSNCKKVGNYRDICPVLLKGKGVVSFGNNVNIGVIESPLFYNSYSYIEARNKTSFIKFGNNIFINNNSTFISEGTEIVIGDNVLIGLNFSVYDSDFHELNPEKRVNGIPKMASVNIQKNVFIGSNVIVLKGVTIGENTIIASGSIVTKSIPPNVIAGGNPCKVIRVI